VVTQHEVIPLVCPSCGADLTGLDTDAVFGCDPCTAAWEPGAEGLTGPYPIFSSDHSTSKSSVSLPFWRLLLDPLLLPDRVKPIDFVYLPAFDLRKRSYFGDPGLAWTIGRRNITSEEPGEGLLGMTLCLDDARRLARYYVLRAVDIDADVSYLKLDISFGEPTIVLVSFFDEDRFLVEPFDGKRYPATAFPDLLNIRGTSLLQPD